MSTTRPITRANSRCAGQLDGCGHHNAVIADASALPAAVAQFYRSGNTPMIRKVLIADYGEVAVELLTKFKRAGVRTVAVYTVEDCNAEHVQVADEICCIGDTLNSYGTDWKHIVSVAEIYEVDAIHPGNGPLCIHERFAEVCSKIGVQLLGKCAEGGST
jgi:pyruvate carboxylase